MNYFRPGDEVKIKGQKDIWTVKRINSCGGGMSNMDVVECCLGRVSFVCFEDLIESANHKIPLSEKELIEAISDQARRYAIQGFDIETFARNITKKLGF